jgi:hypothetical protein
VSGALEMRISPHVIQSSRCKSDLAAGAGYLFHVYLRSAGRIACNPHSDIRAVVADEWVERLDQRQVCTVCAQELMRLRRPEKRAEHVVMSMKAGAR